MWTSRHWDTGRICECVSQRVLSWLQEKANVQVTHRRCFFLRPVPATKHFVLDCRCTVFPPQAAVMCWNNKQAADSEPASTKTKAWGYRKCRPSFRPPGYQIVCFLRPPTISNYSKTFCSLHKDRRASGVIIRLKLKYRVCILYPHPANTQRGSSLQSPSSWNQQLIVISSVLLKTKCPFVSWLVTPAVFSGP